MQFHSQRSRICVDSLECAGRFCQEGQTVCFGEIGINDVLRRSLQAARMKTPSERCGTRPLPEAGSSQKVVRVGAVKGNVMGKKITTAVLTLLGGALTLSAQEALARDCGYGAFAKGAAYSLSRIRTRGWVQLHRVDGEVVHINVDQIVFVTNARNTGGNERAKSRIQLLNGFSDVLETVEEVMQSIKDDEALGAQTGAVFDHISVYAGRSQACSAGLQ
jgi:hypothetical protein